MEDKVILIVDDSASIRREIKVILEKEGYKVREAGNGIGMQSMLEEYGKSADLILMDLTLKAETGFDLIGWVKESKKFSNLPVIILTEHADKENVSMAKLFGVESYLRKPVEPQELIKRVKAVLGNPPRQETSTQE